MTQVFIIEDGMLKKYTGQGGDVIIPEGVTSIERGAFYQCTNVKKVVLPESIKEIWPDSLNHIPEIVVTDTAVGEDLAEANVEDSIISVLDSISCDVKYKVWYCKNNQTAHNTIEFECAWNSGEFNFKTIDGIFDKFLNIKDRIKYAVWRLEYPYKLSEQHETRFRSFLSRNGYKLLEDLIDQSNTEEITTLIKYDAVKEKNIDMLIEYASRNHKTEISAYLLELKEKNNWETSREQFELKDREKVYELWDIKKENPSIIRRYCGEEEFVNFPSTYNGVSITGLADVSEKTPENYKSIKSIIIPEGYTQLGRYSFKGCENLISVTLPDTINEIPDHCFEDCRQLEEIILPDSIVKIGNFAFMGCKKLRNIKFPKELTTIESYAFEKCISLKEIDLGEKVKFLGKHCFFTTGIDTVVYRGDRCFCPECFYYPRYVYTDGNISAQSIPESTHMPMSYYGVRVDDIARETDNSYLAGMNIYGYGKLKAFPKNLTNFKGIDFPQFVRKLGGEYSNSFNKNINVMVTYQIDENDNMVRRARKQGVAVISEIDFLKVISEKDHLDLTPYILPEMDKPAKEKVKKRDKNDPFRPAVIKKSWKYETNDDGTITITDYLGTDTEITIPERVGDAKVTTLGEYLFSVMKPRRRSDRSEHMRNIIKISIPETVDTIQRGAFQGCRKLLNINLPNGLNKIDDATFCWCNSLESIELPDGISEIGKEAFQGCTVLKDINVSEGITIGKSAFQRCRNLADREGFVIRNGILFGYYGTNSCVTIPKGIHTINDKAFDGFEGVLIESIVIPEDVKKIGYAAFSNQGELNNIIIENPSVELESWAFYGCNSLADDEGWIIVRDTLFGYCGNRHDVYVPKRVKKISSFSRKEEYNVLKLHIPAYIDEIYGIMGGENGVWIVGEKGSPAEKYAEMNHLRFVNES